MTRPFVIRTVLLLASCSLLAQSTSREAYRDAFRAWREAEPNLETDAATAGDALAVRAARAATAAAGFGAVRSAFLRQWADDQGQNVLWLQNLVPLTPADFTLPADLQRLVSTETAIVNTSINTFTGDTDRGIQQLRQTLESERTALAALSAAIADRQKAHDKSLQAGEAVQPALAAALAEYQGMTGVLSQSAPLTDKETTAWGAYYTTLPQESRGPATAPGISPTISNVAPVVPNSAPVVSNASPVLSNAAAPTPRASTVTPLPLLRYTGVWVYPTVNGAFFGAQPEFVDLAVHEENGKASGTFYARFKLPPGSTGDPQVRFDFAGDFQPTRIQAFPLLSSDGAKGTIELIPGTAFNLLEINFSMDPLPGKIQKGDLLLVKK